MTTDSHALDHRRRSTTRSPGCAHDARGGISNPVLGMLLFITSEVMFFAGLFAAYFNVRANAPRTWPPINPETNAAVPRSRSCRSSAAGDDPPDPQLVHLPVRASGRSGAATGRRSCATSRSPSSSASSSC